MSDIDIQGGMGDGSVLQDGLRFRPRKSNPGESAAYIPYPVIAVVTDVFTIENEQNRDEETVLLDCHVSDMGIDLFKVPWVGMGKASLDNFIHHSPTAPKKNVDKSPWNDNRIDPKIAENDSVMIMFAFGKVHQPYAVAVLPHNQTEKESPSPRPKKVDGDVYKVRMNGTNFLFDKDGNVKFSNTDTHDETIPKKKKFEIELNENGKTQKVKVNIDNTGDGLFSIMVTKEDGKVNLMSLDAATNTLTLFNENENGINSLIMNDDGIALSTDKDYNENVVGDKTQTIDGNITLNVTDYTFNVSGDYKVTATGKIELVATGEAKLTSTAKATVKGDAGTDVGSGSSPTNVLGATVALAGGGAPVARIGDMVIGTGNLGAPVVSQIVQGSPKVTSA